MFNEEGRRGAGLHSKVNSEVRRGREKVRR